MDGTGLWAWGFGWRWSGRDEFHRCVDRPTVSRKQKRREVTGGAGSLLARAASPALRPPAWLIHTGSCVPTLEKRRKEAVAIGGKLLRGSCFVGGTVHA